MSLLKHKSRQMYWYLENANLEDESIFAALEALGLRLEPAKGRVEALVIDHVERPSEN